MFDEALYSEHRRTSFHRKYVAYCVIGATAFFVIGLIIAAAGAVICRACGSFFPYCLIFIPAAVCLAVPAGFIVSSRKKPYICSKGTVVSIEGGRAEVKVGELTVKRAVSFEKFLSNSSLKSYAPGDEVVLISFTKKDPRPMFYRAV